jgi:hypothetical protein
MMDTFESPGMRVDPAGLKLPIASAMEGFTGVFVRVAVGVFVRVPVGVGVAVELGEPVAVRLGVEVFVGA